MSGARGDSGADVSHRQCRHGWTQTKKKNSQGRDPRTQESKRAQPTAGERAYPTAGKELELLVNKHSAIEKIVEIPSVVE